MAQNVNPIFTLVPHIGFANTDGDGGAAGPLKTQNLNLDGSGTVLTVFTAGANGSFVSQVRAKSAGTNVATVMRVFVNNGTAGAANTVLIGEMAISATTAATASALPENVYQVGFPIPPNWKIMVTIGTTIVAGIFVSVIAGDY